MKKKYIPVREVLIFLAMLAFLLNYLGNKKDRQEVQAKAGMQAEETSRNEETEEKNPNRESAAGAEGQGQAAEGAGKKGQKQDGKSTKEGEQGQNGENMDSEGQNLNGETAQAKGETLADWKKEIEKSAPSQGQAADGSPNGESAGNAGENPSGGAGEASENAQAKNGNPSEGTGDAKDKGASGEGAGKDKNAGTSGEGAGAGAENPNGGNTQAANGAAQAGGGVYTSTAAPGTNPQNAGQADGALPALQEEDIYSFLQGPGSWGERRTWSGEWCEFEIDGNRFGGFGCGLCCMTNVYDTLSPYEVSPWDMFENARVASDYSPGGEYGAIDWQEMRCTLDVCGISGELHKKPPTFEEFRAQVRCALSAIVLVSNGNEDTYWPNTKGHYVNIWLYERDDTIFLAEPGNPGRNRTRIPLRHLYDSLKMGSSYQYLLVTGYDEEENRWRASGISENWCRP